MKKILSCLMAVALVFSLMSVSVFAGTTHPNHENPASNDVDAGTQYWVVGTQGGINGVNNGSDTANATVNSDVKVNFGSNNTDNTGNGDGSTIVHKYAVDITYGDLTLDLTNLTMESSDPELENETFYMVWDVNEYEYVLCTKNGDSYEKVIADGNDITNEEIIEILNTPYVVESVQITNHSDLAVDTTLVFNNSNNTDITWTIIDDTVNTSTTTFNEEIGKATAKTTAAGEPSLGSELTFEAKPADDMGWLAVINNLHNNANPTVVANITVTIAPVTP